MGSTTTTYRIDGDAVMMDVQGTTHTAYSYGNGLLREGNETPMFDGLGSERTVTNSSASAAGSLTTDAFGKAVTSGYRDDVDAGLKVGCRYYDSEVGRFTTRDTDLDEAPMPAAMGTQ